MKFYLYNTTQSLIAMTDIGLELPAEDHVEISDNQLKRFYRVGCQLETHLNSGDIVLSTDEALPPASSYSADDAIRILDAAAISERIYYDNTVSQLDADELQGAVDELKTLVDATGQNGIVVKDEGDNIVDTPHTQVDFIGNGVSVVNNNGVAEVTIPGGGSATFGSEFNKAVSEVESNTTNTAYQEKVSLDVSSIPAGTYRIGVYFEGSCRNQSVQLKAKVEIDDSEIIIEQKSGFQDEWTPFCGFFYKDFSSGSYTIDLDYCSSLSTQYVKIRRARLEFWRVL